MKLRVNKSKYNCWSLPALHPLSHTRKIQSLINDILLSSLQTIKISKWYIKQNVWCIVVLFIPNILTFIMHCLRHVMHCCLHYFSLRTTIMKVKKEIFSEQFGYVKYILSLFNTLFLLIFIFLYFMFFCFRFHT